MKTIWNTQNKRKQHSTYIKLVEKIYNENNKPTRYKKTVESMLREFFSKTSKKKYTWKREVFKRLLIHLYNQKCYALLRNYSYVAVLHNISGFGDKIVRNIEDWKNENYEVEDQISAIIKHCFALYNTPEFLENSFYSSIKIHMLWYIQLGKGKSVKNLSQIPVVLSNKMAHEFRNAPSFLSTNEALRYAQALGFDASIKTAKIIAFSRLSIIIGEHEGFLTTVIQFFAKEKDLKLSELDMIIDYLLYKYGENQTFSMKNKTLVGLTKKTEEWHQSIYINRKSDVLSWSSSGIKPLYIEKYVNNKKVIYRTIELLNSIELYNEGYEMQHCVSEYDYQCKKGTSSIFSLQKEVEGEAIKRLTTIEVGLPNNQIIQAKAKCNQEPDSKSLELINIWINNSKVNRKKKMAFERPFQQEVNLGAQRRATEQHGDNFLWIIKIIFWILYFILRFSLMT